MLRLILKSVIRHKHKKYTRAKLFIYSNDIPCNSVYVINTKYNIKSFISRPHKKKHFCRMSMCKSHVTYRQFLFNAASRVLTAAAQFLDQTNGRFLVHTARLVSRCLLKHLLQPSFAQRLFLFQAIWSCNMQSVEKCLEQAVLSSDFQFLHSLYPSNSLFCLSHHVEIVQSNDVALDMKKISETLKILINPLAPEFSLNFQHILYLKCEYYRNQKRQHYEINGILKRKKTENVQHI